MSREESTKELHQPFITRFYLKGPGAVQSDPHTHTLTVRDSAAMQTIWSN